MSGKDDSTSGRADPATSAARHGSDDRSAQALSVFVLYPSRRRSCRDLERLIQKFRDQLSDRSSIVASWVKELPPSETLANAVILNLSDQPAVEILRLHPQVTAIIDLIYAESDTLCASIGELLTDPQFVVGRRSALRAPRIIRLLATVVQSSVSPICWQVWEQRAHPKSASHTLESLLAGAPVMITETIEQIGSEASDRWRHLQVGLPSRRLPRWNALVGAQYALRYLLFPIAVRLRRARIPQWTIGIAPDASGELHRPDTPRWIEPPRDGFFADPFVFIRESHRLLFFEELRFSDWRGFIVAAPIAEDGSIEVHERRTILTVSHHCSFPQIIESEGELFLLIEEATIGCVRLHKAVEFPWRFQPDRVLIPELCAIDPVLIQHGSTWFLFVTDGSHGNFENNLRLYYAESLSGEFREHPLSPIRRGLNGSRMAGPLIVSGGRVFRLGQNCEAAYGSAIEVFEVTALSSCTYVEVHLGSITPDPTWRFHGGMHTYSQSAGVVAIDAFRA